MQIQTKTETSSYYFERNKKLEPKSSSSSLVNSSGQSHDVIQAVEEYYLCNNILQRS